MKVMKEVQNPSMQRATANDSRQTSERSEVPVRTSKASRPSQASIITSKVTIPPSAEVKEAYILPTRSESVPIGTSEASAMATKDSTASSRGTFEIVLQDSYKRASGVTGNLQASPASETILDPSESQPPRKKARASRVGENHDFRASSVTCGDSVTQGAFGSSVSWPSDVSRNRSLGQGRETSNSLQPDSTRSNSPQDLDTSLTSSLQRKPSIFSRFGASEASVSSCP